MDLAGPFYIFSEATCTYIVAKYISHKYQHTKEIRLEHTFFVAIETKVLKTV